MVVFVDLEGDKEEYADLRNRPSFHYNAIEHLQRLGLEESRSILSESPRPREGDESKDGTSKPRGKESPSSFARALSAYPIALSLTSHLDLNDLHSLSLTCSSIHKGLTQFSANLVTHSLSCTYAHQPLLSDLIAQYNAAIIASHEASQTDPSNAATRQTIPNLLTAFSVPLYPQNRVAGGSRPAQTTGVEENKRVFRTSKINPCARDLVAECRKCGTIVCRNCASKPPSDSCLKDRFRRLCRVCLDAPLEAHLHRHHTNVESSSPLSSASSSNTSLLSPSPSSSPSPDLVLFTHPAFYRMPCTCATSGVYLCQPCGSSLRSGDTTYKRVWTWRSRYSTHIGGGLGTGLGTGDQGQKCARGESCLDDSCEGGGVCWVEIDCSEDSESDTTSCTAMAAAEAGYHRQEIEGIGGVVKKKVKKRVKVGGTVWEFDDERESGRYLEREARGEVRSWCGWCERVCLGKDDVKAWKGV